MKYLRRSDWSDVWYLSAHLRPEDVAECEAHGRTPLDALAEGLEKSDVCYTLLDPSGTPAGMLGVGSGGCIWLLGTPGIEKHSMTFLRHSRAVLEELYRETGYDLLYNYTFIDNELHHRWLRWLGFSFLRTVQLPPHNKLFIEFGRLRGK